MVKKRVASISAWNTRWSSQRSRLECRSGKKQKLSRMLSSTYQAEALRARIRLICTRWLACLLSRRTRVIDQLRCLPRSKEAIYKSVRCGSLRGIRRPPSLMQPAAMGAKDWTWGLHDQPAYRRLQTKEIVVRYSYKNSNSTVEVKTIR
jgi:hypothetical protein